MGGISLVCFGASYAVALVLEVTQAARPRRVVRVAALGFGVAGFIAQTVFLALHFARPGGPGPLSTRAGSTLFLAWILAIHYLVGAFHYRRKLWGVFVLPVLVGLVGLAAALGGWDDGGVATPAAEVVPGLGVSGETAWRAAHGWLVLLAAVGVTVGFVASIMYLVQVARLRAKAVGGPGGRLFSLERLETMNRRAINWSFILLTAGVLIGIGLMAEGHTQIQGWADPRVLGAALLWSLYLFVIYLRYGAHSHGRRLAQLTIVAFVLLLFTLVSSHTVAGRGVDHPGPAAGEVVP